MDDRQLMVSAISLFCDGYSARQVGQALSVSEDRAQALIEASAEVQKRGEMGNMRITRGKDGQPVVRDNC